MPDVPSSAAREAWVPPVDFEIPKLKRVCFATGQEMKVGQTYVSALVETPLGVERRDYLKANWPGESPDVLSHWQGTVPELPGAGKPKPISNQAIAELFDQQEIKIAQGDAEAEKLRFVLGLWLIRRKQYKLLTVEYEGEQEFLVLQKLRDKTTVRIRDPRMSEERLRDVEESMRQLLERLASVESST